MREDIVPLFDYLRLLRKRALEEVIEGLLSSEYARAMNEWEEFLNEPVPKKPVAANATPCPSSTWPARGFTSAIEG